MLSDLLWKVRDYLFDEEIRTVIKQHPTFASHEIVEILHEGLRVASELEAEDPVSCVRLRHDWQYVLSCCLITSPIAPAQGLTDQTSDALTEIEATDEVSKMLCNLAFCSAWDHRCSGPLCLNTYSSSGTAFKVCGGCWVSKYCSRRCQKRAWSHPQAAHRDICGVYAGYTYGWGDAEDQMRSTDSFRNACANVEALKATHISELSEFLMPRIFRCVVIRDSHNTRFEGDSGGDSGVDSTADSACSHIKSPYLLRESFRMNGNRILNRVLESPSNRLL
jgi:hypothetical protein